MIQEIFVPDALRRWHQLQCGRTRFRGDHRGNIRCTVSLVLRLIGTVYLVIERLIGACVHKRHVLRHSASSNTSRMPLLDMTEPGCFTTTVCPHVQIITDANDPDRDGLSMRAILLERCKLQFICCFNSFEIIFCPFSHCIPLFAQRPVIRSRCSGYRAPWIVIFEMALLISRRSSGLSSTASAPIFSSRRSSLREPGMGTIHDFWASSQASAI